MVSSSCGVCCVAGVIEIKFACSLSSLSCSRCIALVCACMSCSLLSGSKNMT